MAVSFGILLNVLLTEERNLRRFVRFSLVAHCRRICKNRVYKPGSACFFLSSRGERSYGSTRLLSKETVTLHAELNKIAEAAVSGYFAEVNFLKYIYSVLVAKKH